MKGVGRGFTSVIDLPVNNGHMLADNVAKLEWNQDVICGVYSTNQGGDE